jgi:hypothetical protein
VWGNEGKTGMDTQTFAEALENAYHGVRDMAVIEQLHNLKRKINALDGHRTPVIILSPDIDWAFIPFNMIVTNRLVLTVSPNNII